MKQAQDPGLPTPVGSFSITELGDKADKIGKDDNFRGLTIFNDVVSYTKGSGSNGVKNSVFRRHHWHRVSQRLGPAGNRC